MTLKVDVLLPSGIEKAAEAARHVETWSVDGVWAPESSSDPFLDLVLPAIETTIPTLGTSVAVALARSPFTTAMASWRLQEASKGRFILGIGSQVKGHIERRFGMTWDSPGPRMREYVQAVKAIFKAFRKEVPLDFKGRHYTHTLLPAVFDPGPIDHPDPPVIMAGINDYNLETIGLVADGLAAHPIASPRFLAETCLPAMERGLKRSNRSRADLIVQAIVLLVVGDTEEQRKQAESFARLQIAWSGSTRTYSRIFESLGWPDVPSKLHALMGAGDFQGMLEVISDEMLEEFAVVASPDDAPAVIRKKYEPVADRLLFYNLTSSPYAADGGRMREFLGAVRS